MLIWMSSLALAGDLEVTVAHMDDEMTATLTGVAPCSRHEIELEGLEGVWEIALRPMAVDGGVKVAADVEHRSLDTKMELSPTLLLAPGEVGEVHIGETWLEITASGFEDVVCPEVVSTRRRVERTTRTRDE